MLRAAAARHREQKSRSAGFPTKLDISPPVFVANLKLRDLPWHYGGTCAHTAEGCLQRVRADRGARFPEESS